MSSLLREYVRKALLEHNGDFDPDVYQRLVPPGDQLALPNVSPTALHQGRHIAHISPGIAKIILEIFVMNKPLKIPPEAFPLYKRLEKRKLVIVGKNNEVELTSFGKEVAEAIVWAQEQQKLPLV